MIPKPFVFKGINIDTVIDQYNTEMPKHLSEFEATNGPGQVIIASIYSDGFAHILVAVIWQDKARIEAMEASKKITEDGSELLSSLTSRLQQVFNSEGCNHEYESSVDDNGNEKIICKLCRTPLA